MKRRPIEIDVDETPVAVGGSESQPIVELPAPVTPEEFRDRKARRRVGQISMECAVFGTVWAQTNLNTWMQNVAACAVAPDETTTSNAEVDGFPQSNVPVLGYGVPAERPTYSGHSVASTMLLDSLMARVRVPKEVFAPPTGSL